MLQGFNLILFPDFQEERFKRTKGVGGSGEGTCLEDKLKHISQNDTNTILKPLPNKNILWIFSHLIKILFYCYLQKPSDSTEGTTLRNTHGHTKNTHTVRNTLTQPISNSVPITQSLWLVLLRTRGQSTTQSFTGAERLCLGESFPSMSGTDRN